MRAMEIHPDSHSSHLVVPRRGDYQTLLSRNYAVENAPHPALPPSDGERENTKTIVEGSPDGERFEKSHEPSLSPSDGEG
jgi:hypothetical protein